MIKDQDALTAPQRQQTINRIGLAVCIPIRAFRIMEAYSTYYLVIFIFVMGVHGTLQKESTGNGLEFQRRFLFDQNSTKPWISLEQFVSCSLTCLPGYEKLSEACCNTGIDAVCLNLPWNVLTTSLGLCTGRILSTIHASPYQTALQQFASCSLRCIHGYEKLTDICCTTGIKEVCSNLPWDLLKPYLGLCKEPSTTTISSSTSTITTIPPTTPSPTPTTTKITKPSLYWLPWGEWRCELQQGACFQRRLRNCSTGVQSDCTNRLGGAIYNIQLCSPETCPAFFTTSPTTTNPSTPAQGTCHDDPSAIGCREKDILTEVCKSVRTAWDLCPASCNLCDTCWDYLNCSGSSAQKLFCDNEEDAVKFCRKTCGKCDQKPVVVKLNTCGDPVANDLLCEILQSEVCICNDPDTRVLCQNYCENKCQYHPFSGSDCVFPDGGKRDAAFRRILRK